MGMLRGPPKVNFIAPIVRLFVAMFFLLIVAAVIQASASNKWRLQFSGKANSDGVIVLKISPVEGEPITAEVSVKNNAGENAVAKTVAKALQEQLPKDAYRVERDDGEDVLIKNRHGAKDFDVEIVSNSVDGVHISRDME